MKCPRCLAVCLDDDPSCPACGARFVADPNAPLPPPARHSFRAVRMALVSLAVGTGVGPLVGPMTGWTLARSAASAGALDVNLLLWALAGAGLGLGLGYGLGVALSRPK